jgi:hypothetical protein
MRIIALHKIVITGASAILMASVPGVLASAQSNDNSSSNSNANSSSSTGNSTSSSSDTSTTSDATGAADTGYGSTAGLQHAGYVEGGVALIAASGLALVLTRRPKKFTDS